MRYRVVRQCWVGRGVRVDGVWWVEVLRVGRQGVVGRRDRVGRRCSRYMS